MKLPYQPLISPLAGFFACILIILLCGTDPGAALRSLFTGSFTSAYYFGSMLNTAAFLMTAGTGAAIALKSGNMNLGGEGQVYLGGLIAGAILSADWPLPPAVQLAAATAAVLAGGAAMAGASALLRELRGAEVLLTTFLLSAAALPLIDGAITTANGRSHQNLLALPYIKEAFRFPQLLPPSPLTASLVAAMLLCVAAWLFMRFTFAGRKMLVWGTAPLFARYCGYSAAANSFGTLAASGALHALTGMFAVCGTYYTCHKGFYSGMGWNALSAALIVSAHPLALIPASLVLAWLYTSADRVGLTQGFGFDISGIVQGCVLFAIAIPFSMEKLAAYRSGVRAGGTHGRKAWRE